MGCPFGFNKAHPLDCDGSDEGSDQGSPAASLDNADAPRFDNYVQRPREDVSWFYANQIRCEKEFQEKKAKLREQARYQLDEVFAKKGKKLLLDSDEESMFDISSDELSAWDSDVHSLASMISCADSWIQESEYAAPAEWAFKGCLAATVAACGYSVWQAAAAHYAASRYVGILSSTLLPLAGAVVAVLGLAVAVGGWGLLPSRSKKALLVCQLCSQVVYAAAAGIALVAYAAPLQVDVQVKHSACARYFSAASSSSSSSSSNLCRELPFIEGQASAHAARLLWGVGAEAAALLALLLASTFYMWELGWMAQKALKHKRRRRQRKHSIPWDKIRVEEMGPVSFCGQQVPQQQWARRSGGKVAAAAVQGRGGGKCPFGFTAGEQGSVPAGKKVN